MAWRIAEAIRNGMADAFETAVGASPILRIYTGPKPANLIDARTGTLLASIVLPADWLAAAAGGAKTLIGGPYTDTAADAGGVAGYGTLFNGAGTVILCDGEVTDNAGAGPIKLVNTTITAGQPVDLTAFTVTMPAGT